MKMDSCPVCKRKAIAFLTDDKEGAVVDCPACGKFTILFNVANDLKDDHRPRLSHRIRKMQGLGNRRVIIDRELAEKLVAEPLPSLREQADALLLWAGGKLRETNPGGYLLLHPPYGEPFLTAMTGAFDGPSAWRIVTDHLPEERFAEYRNEGGNRPEIRITPKGWDRYEELKRSTESRIAFMAMPFSDLLTRIFEECFKPAVADTGFELRRVIDRQKAGLIDDQLRVLLRRARFTIADLTHGNPGAYWEAGFAEGLGRPVIYTCERSCFDNPETRPHFDTNHYSTVIWKEKELDKAAEELKARIRATLPDEADPPKD